MAKVSHGIGGNTKQPRIKKTKSARTRPDGYQPRKKSGR
jgi:hypothetical protein